jgi:hypothetical protein
MMKLGLPKMDARGIGLGSLPAGPWGGKTILLFTPRFDRRPGAMHPETAMTTALSHFFSGRSRFAGACALTIIVVIFILPL